MKRKITAVAISIILLMWIGITITSYYKHRQVVERYSVNEYVDLGDIGLYVMDVQKFREFILNSLNSMNGLDRVPERHKGLKELKNKKSSKASLIKGLEQLPYWG